MSIWWLGKSKKHKKISDHEFKYIIFGRYIFTISTYKTKVHIAIKVYKSLIIDRYDF